MPEWSIKVWEENQKLKAALISLIYETDYGFIDNKKGSCILERDKIDKAIENAKEALGIPKEKYLGRSATSGRDTIIPPDAGIEPLAVYKEM